MEQKNKFYIFKRPNSIYRSIIPGNAYNIATGEIIQQDGTSIITKYAVPNVNRVIVHVEIFSSQVTILKWNKLNEYLGYSVLSDSSVDIQKIEYVISDSDIYYIAFMFNDTTISTAVNCDTEEGYLINPYYKKLEKKYNRENGQMFFKESLSGQLNLFGNDYNIVKDASFEEILYFYVYDRYDNLFVSASFNKSDCRFNHAKKSVELNLKYTYRYSNILDAYKNTYDLIKLNPALTPITLTKRCVVQIYIQGSNVVSNYAGGTYWETEVNEVVDDYSLLYNKYHFQPGPTYKEVSINLVGSNPYTNGTYLVKTDSSTWETISSFDKKTRCGIEFVKVKSANEIYNPYTDNARIGILSIGAETGGLYNFGDADFYIYDTYRIDLYYINSQGQKIVEYTSKWWYGKDSTFTLAYGLNNYPMVTPDSATGIIQLTLGECVIDYTIWARLLCDVSSYKRNGSTVITYKLPLDDFVSIRQNYKFCIGLSGFDEDGSVVKIYHSENTSAEPTPYGMNDYGTYFLPPYSISGQYYYPLSRSSWTNTSLWVLLDEIIGFEEWCSVTYKQYILKNSYHISDVIKALLHAIDPSIKHENSAEYSSFLYGHEGASAALLGNCDIYITQKTNILKGQYDQAAQKAEITLERVMNMLKDCFRCYWFIDNEKRFRIEHVSYFMNGMSYAGSSDIIDLTNKKDKFNKIKALYNQEEIEFNKDELISRYEFSWADNATKAMGSDLVINVNNAYTQKDIIEDISVDSFSSDIDYMLFKPEDFSNDGFALILADQEKIVPIVHSQLVDEKQFDRAYNIHVQNWYASFNQLVNHYMYDISGNNISYNNIIAGHLQVMETKRYAKHKVRFPSTQLDIDTSKLIATELGSGYIEEMSVDIDTYVAEIELRYTPD